MSRKLNIQPGDRFGKLTIIKEIEPNHFYRDYKRRRFKLICDCGNFFESDITNIRTKNTISCGCYIKENNIKLRFIHGDRDKNSIHHYIRQLHFNLKQRCYNVNYKRYKDYGGRGIKMFTPWVDNYLLFKEWILENLDERPEGYSLDRENNDGNYEPGNLRWADRVTQNNNKRNNRLK